MSLMATDLTPRLLHDLSQCTSALICSLELSSMRCENAEGRLDSLSGALELAQEMQRKIVFFRRLAEAQSPCASASRFLPQFSIAAACEATRELAEAMEVRTSFRCEREKVWGNADRFRLAVTYLLDWLIADRRPAWIEFVLSERVIGQLGVATEPCERTTKSEDSLNIALAAFASMGMELQIRQREPVMQGEVVFSSSCYTI